MNRTVAGLTFFILALVFLSSFLALSLRESRARSSRDTYEAWRRVEDRPDVSYVDWVKMVDAGMLPSRARD